MHLKDITNIAGITKSDLLRERIGEAAHNENVLHELCEQYRPMILRVASSVSGRFITIHDDEYAIALEAFCDAVKRYNGQASPETFARVVIKNRLIDHMRAARPVTASLDAEMEMGFEPSDEIDAERESIAVATRAEIVELSAILHEYGISFNELPSVSPKHEKTRHECGRVVRFLCDSPKLCAEMRRKKTLPIREICQNCIIPRKTVERHRKYIVTATEVCIGSFPIIAEYLKKYLPPKLVPSADVPI